jgi:hypothetical protein
VRFALFLHALRSFRVLTHDRGQRLFGALSILVPAEARAVS